MSSDVYSCSFHRKANGFFLLSCNMEGQPVALCAPPFPCRNASTFGSMTSLYPHLSGSCTFSTVQDGCQQGALAQAVRPVTARTAIPPHVPTVPSYNRQTTNCALTRSKSKRMNSSPDTSVKNKVR